MILAFAIKKSLLIKLPACLLPNRASKYCLLKHIEKEEAKIKG